MKRFALIGAGLIGSVHARNLAAHPGVSFDLIADAEKNFKVIMKDGKIFKNTLN